MNHKTITLLLIGSLFCFQAFANDRELIQASSPTITPRILNTTNTAILSDIANNHVSILKTIDKFVHNQEWRRDAIQQLHDLSPDNETTYALTRAQQRCDAWQEGATAFRTLLESIKGWDVLEQSKQEVIRLMNEKREYIQQIYSEDYKRPKNQQDTTLYNRYYVQETFFKEASFLGKLTKFTKELTNFSNVQIFVKQNFQSPAFFMAKFDSANEFLDRLQQSIDMVNFSMGKAPLPQQQQRKKIMRPLFENVLPCNAVSSPANNEMEAYQQTVEHINKKFATPIIEELVASLKEIKRKTTKKAEKKDITERFTNLISTPSQFASVNNLSSLVQEGKTHEIRKLAFNDVKELLGALSIPYRDKDNKIIATNPVNHKDTLVIHTHGKTTTEDGGIINDATSFIQRLIDIS